MHQLNACPPEDEPGLDLRIIMSCISKWNHLQELLVVNFCPWTWRNVLRHACTLQRINTVWRFPLMKRNKWTVHPPHCSWEQRGGRWRALNSAVHSFWWHKVALSLCASNTEIKKNKTSTQSFAEQVDVKENWGSVQKERSFPRYSSRVQTSFRSAGLFSGREEVTDEGRFSRCRKPRADWPSPSLFLFIQV